MQAIILAAGMGKRLKELTKNNTKCMVKVNGTTLIDRMLRQIEQHNLSRIIIVVGYEGKKLIEHISAQNIKTPIIYVNNPIYNKTNNIYSLSLAKRYLLEEDTLLFESDLIFEDGVIDLLLEDPRDTLALVDKYERWMDGTCVKLGKDDSIDAFVPGKHFNFKDTSDYYKTVNIYKFSQSFSEKYYVPFLEAYEEALGLNEYYEQVLRVIAMLDNPPIKAKKLSGQRWYEIDDIQDLNIAESMFTPDLDERLDAVARRFGGYWRYPKLLDFCYLVNPYFPPQKMADELKASFEVLLTQYPSGMYVNSLLAGKNFGIHQQNILVGNGAAELIKSFIEKQTGKLGFIRPTFEEYPNRYSGEKVVFVPENPDFSYTAKDIIAFFDKEDVSALILVNPENPSGNYIPKEDLLHLVQWTKDKGIQLLVDESFVDFAEEENSTLLQQELLESNSHLSVMKSISKSYGVPGLRLGIFASGNTEMIAAMKKDVSIWNINSFAEYYMQIAEKYQKDYDVSLSLIKAERKRFLNELSNIPGLRPIPSQANYIMAELTGAVTSRELAKVLLAKYDLLIKDLSVKLNGKQYVRIAVRDTEDNNKLLNALKQEMR